MMKAEIGREGEKLCSIELERRGWVVEDMNQEMVNMPNSDLRIRRADKLLLVQVKSSAKERGYITGGSVNKTVVSGGAIFNRKTGYAEADFVIFVACLNSVPRFFILPVSEAETIFRKNISAYFLSPKLDGGTKKPTGQSDIFVGEGYFPHARIVPDQREEVLPCENQWGILNGARILSR